MVDIRGPKGGLGFRKGPDSPPLRQQPHRSSPPISPQLRHFAPVAKASQPQPKPANPSQPQPTPAKTKASQSPASARVVYITDAMRTKEKRIMTLAEKIADMYDGQNFALPDERSSLEELLKDSGARRVAHGSDTAHGPVRYSFIDDSAITIVGACWDLGYADCFCWHSVGHTDECQEKNTHRRDKLSQLCEGRRMNSEASENPSVTVPTVPTQEQVEEMVISPDEFLPEQVHPRAHTVLIDRRQRMVGTLVLPGTAQDAFDYIAVRVGPEVSGVVVGDQVLLGPDPETGQLRVMQLRGCKDLALVHEDSILAVIKPLPTLKVSK